ncbi:MAG: hypothetical protein V1736_08520 [Pseudomonadota bacterium]
MKRHDGIDISGFRAKGDIGNPAPVRMCRMTLQTGTGPVFSRRIFPNRSRKQSLSASLRNTAPLSMLLTITGRKAPAASIRDLLGIIHHYHFYAATSTHDPNNASLSLQGTQVSLD